MSTINGQKYSNRKREHINPIREYLYVLFPLVVLLVLPGCSTTLQSGWNDFNAYFNTYYNAKTSFERGVHQIERQEEEINPERPIRIFQKPIQAGRQDFDKAIEKSADILRFHPTSKYVDNAIEIIGQSYFYQGQFFSASQKFLELYNATPDEMRKQKAIYWRGRSFLELESYNEGLSYLKSHLFSTDNEWDSEIEANIKLIIGQLHVYNREWEDAEIYIAEGKQNITDRKLIARANFLHGQIFEELERYEDAFEAYDIAMHNANPELGVTFNASRKKAQVARKMGKYQWSYDSFVSMTRDDNYFEFMGDLLYEVARTLHESGDYRGAQEEYEYVLSQTLSEPARETTAKIYYSLAEIYKDHYDDFSRAAAYYDTSAQQVNDLSKLPENFDAQLMSTSYGNYTDLITRAQRLDSLLWLGSLPEAEFDSVITSIRKERVLEMEQMLEDEQRAEDQFVSVDNIEITDAAEDTENGFLNHLNPQIMTQVGQTFRAYWGNRPLVDDWRRVEAVRMAAISRNNADSNDIDEDLTDEEIMEEMLGEQGNAPAEQPLIDLSDIPFSEDERTASKEQIAETYYEIGNLFFLTLNMPDSAISRYNEVLEKFPDSKHVPQAMYSLSETYRSIDDSIRARVVAERLVDRYPRSNFAIRMAERYDLGLNEEPEETNLTRQDSLNQIYNETNNDLNEGERQENSEKLKYFAYTYPDSDKAPVALFRAATEYITLAREDSVYQQGIAHMNQINSAWNLKEKELEELKQSSYAMLEDSTLTEEEFITWSSIVDSSLAPPDLDGYFQYEGAYWDSARVVLTDISENYPSFSEINRVESLKGEIKPSNENDRIERDGTVFTCDELDTKLEMTSDMVELLLTENSMQEQINSMMINTTFTLLVTINKTGEPGEIIPLNKEHDADFMQDLIDAFKGNIKFSPPTIDGEPVNAECDIYIPVESY